MRRTCTCTSLNSETIGFSKKNGPIHSLGFTFKSYLLFTTHVLGEVNIK